MTHGRGVQQTADDGKGDGREQESHGYTTSLTSRRKSRSRTLGLSPRVFAVVILLVAATMLVTEAPGVRASPVVSDAGPAICEHCPAGDLGCIPNCTPNPCYPPTYVAESITSVTVTQEPASVLIDWHESPAGSSTTVLWGPTTSYGYSQNVAGSGSYSVTMTDNLEPATTIHFEISVSPANANCKTVYTANSYAASFYFPGLWGWSSPGSASNAFSSDPASSGLCAAGGSGGLGNANGVPNPPSADAATGVVTFYESANATECAVYQITATVGFYTPQFVAPWSGEYTFTYAWTVDWGAGFACIILPIVPGESAGTKGNLQIMGNLVEVSSGQHVSSSDGGFSIASWNTAIVADQKASDDQLYSVGLTANLVAGTAYWPYSYVSAWIYVEATGEGAATAYISLGGGGHQAVLTYDSLLYDG